MHWLQLAGVTVAALFPLINPIGAVPLFASLTRTDTKAYRNQMALKAAIFTFAILAVFEYAGHLILVFFGVSLGMLQIAGGLIVGHTAWGMSTGAPKVSSAEQKQLVHKKHRGVIASVKDKTVGVVGAIEDVPSSLAEFVHRGGAADEDVDANSAPIVKDIHEVTPGTAAPAAPAAPAAKPAPIDISFSPMAMPMLAGPGSIGVVIGLSTQSGGDLGDIGILLGIAVMALLSWACLRAAGPLIRLLGDTGIMAMQRIFGFIVLAIAVALIANGISALFGIPLKGGA